MDQERESTDSSYNYLGDALFALCFAGAVSVYYPGVIPFGFFEFWGFRASPLEAVLISWPLFLWGVVATSVLVFSKYNGYKNPPHEVFLAGTVTSLWAGVVEEVSFRWLIFFSGIIGAYILDFLLLGFLGLHIVQWFYMTVLCPVANFFTLGLLEPYLSGQYGWAVAAAMISSNGHFRDGHAYLGILGFINSWFCGMYFFYLTLNYGLVAAIIVHFLYDFLIFLTVTVDVHLERRRA